jgi:hypothetical protein
MTSIGLIIPPLRESIANERRLPAPWCIIEHAESFEIQRKKSDFKQNEALSCALGLVAQTIIRRYWDRSNNILALLRLHDRRRFL